ncbi:MAG: DNA-processing protein DprA [Alphaproteobacteria bacterium]|nr:DNA-processing protein DprA [Alphaproteobacteria bacterium]
MNKQKLISYIRLINTSGIGPVNFKRILAKYGSIDKALSELSLKREIYPLKKAEEEILTAEIKRVKIITLEDEEYPYNLKQIEDCPPVLYALGNVELLKNNNMLAVVGSRNASISACRYAKEIASDISKRDIIIVSGMARGIDAAAHTGALMAEGNTIAVLGTGVDVVYPSENQKLYENLMQHGLILSEYPFHTKPQASNFPRRNRIVSGLSKGVLVLEAGIQSGSLITARQALEQGREVYAVPGAPYDGRSSGCNKLLKEGAVLVESARDILENFNFTQEKFEPKQPQKAQIDDLFEYSLDNKQNNSDSAEKRDDYSDFLSLISEQGEDIDDLIRSSGLDSEQVLMKIVELELDGKVIRLPGNKIAKA